MDNNPWSATGWNLSAQAAYLKQYGRERAEARARDAGSFFGATKPPGGVKSKGRFGQPLPKLAPPKADGKHPTPPALSQPPKALGLFTDHLTDQQKRVLYFVRKRRTGGTASLTVNFDLGLDVDYSIKFSSPPIDLGFTMDFNATNLYREIDIILNPGDISFAASFNMGLSGPRVVFGGVTPVWIDPIRMGFSENQPAIELAREIPHTTFRLGEDGMRAAFGNQREITANVDMGLDESWLFNEFNHGVFNINDVGLHLTATLELSRNISTPPWSLGFSEAAFVEPNRLLFAFMDMGFDVTTQPNADVQASFGLGLDETFGGFDNEVHIAVPSSGISLGFAEDAVTSYDYELTASESLGFDAAAVLASETPAIMDVGFVESASITADFNLLVSEALGFDVAATVTRERDMTANAALGFDQITQQPTADVGIVAVAVGFDEAALPELFIPPVSMLMGFSEDASISFEMDMVATMDMGFDVTEFTYIERNSAADIHMGFLMDPLLQMDENLTIAIDIGFSEAADILHETDIVATANLGFDVTVSAQQLSPAALIVTFLQNEPLTTSWNSGNSTIITGENFGAADSARWIVVTYGNTIARTLNSATIGGVSATILTQNGVGASEATGIIMAFVPTGTSGTVQLNWSGTPDIVSIGVYRVIAPEGMSSAAVFAGSSFGSNSVPNYSETLALTDGSAYFACDMATNSGGAPGFSVTNATKDSDETTSNRSFATDHAMVFGNNTTTFNTTAVHGGSINAHSYAVLAPEADIVAAVALGITEAATVGTDVVTVIPASGKVANAVGFSEAATVTMVKSLGTVAIAMGLTDASAVQATAPAVTCTYLAELHLNNQSSATYTFSAVGIGTANVSRYVAVAYNIKGNTSQSISTFTIGGVTATLVGTAQGVTSSTQGMVGIAIALVPTGTTANIVITLSAGFTASTSNGIGIDVYTAVGVVNTTPTDTFEQNTATNPTKAFSVPGGGFVIVICSTPSTSGARSLGTDFPADDNFVQFVAGKFRVTGHNANATGSPVTKNLAGAALTSGATLIPCVGYAWGH